MPPILLPVNEPFVDLKTGLITRRWRRALDQLNDLLGGLAFENISGTITLAQLVEHQETHFAGGSDAIKIDELAAARDVTDLNASTTAHGLLPKLSGNPLHTLKGDGTWS
jgi:hypothetical protein